MTRRSVLIRRVALVFLVILALVLAGWGIFWWKFLNEGDQDFAGDDRRRFAYGSIGSELIAGIPYPIFWVLPRVFPDLIEKHATAGYGQKGSDTAATAPSASPGRKANLCPPACRSGASAMTA